MAMLLNRKALLTKEKLEVEKVDLGKDEYVYVRQMTGRERDTFEASLIKEVKEENGGLSYKTSSEDFRAKLAVCTLCDENGVALLEPGDFPELSQSMSAARLERIVEVAQRLNKVTEAAKEAIVKNLNADQVGNSSSDSVNN